VGIVQENVQNTATSHVFDFEKRKKCRNNNTEAYRLEDHGDHPRSVLLTFTQLPKPLF